MDLFSSLSCPENQPIQCIDMHTCGEPTRIVIQGYPEVTGTLLEQRNEAKQKHDHIRRRLMLEPRGHYDMYGAILRQETEMVRSGEADIGVLFMTNDGYSTMCGHATIALGRFLVDTHDLEVFPGREHLQFDSTDRIITLRLHAPCGVVTVSIPTTADGRKSDPARPVSFTSVDSFATGIGIQLTLPPHPSWPEGVSITADFAYGGAFYCLVPVDQLSFMEHGLLGFDIDVMNEFTRILKESVNNDASLAYLFKHPDQDDLSFLYSVILTQAGLGEALSGTGDAETGLCFFSDQQVDRSPTGSGVSARLAASYARKQIGLNETRTYHSIVSLHLSPQNAFQGSVIKEIANASAMRCPNVTTRVEGFASYTGVHIFVVENDDLLWEAFAMSALAAQPIPR